jgi:membrane protease YdiL (CAAX protease family)
LKNGLLQHLKPREKLIYFFAFLLLGWFVAQMISVLLCQTVFDINITDYDFKDFSRIDVIRLNKILNLVSHIFMFILPVFLFVKLISQEPNSFILNKKPSTKFWLAVPFLFIGFTVFNELLSYVNHAIDFSFISKEFQSSLEYEQAVKSKAIYAYVGTTWKSFFVNVFLLALIPAIGEELTFRGVLQHLISKSSGSVYVCVIISAFIFAFIHFQPFNFLPIFALGLCYGFVLLYAGSIWVTMILHFANNALSIGLMHLNRYFHWGFDTTLVGDLIALVISATVLYLLVKKFPNMSKWNETKGNFLR